MSDTFPLTFLLQVENQMSGEFSQASDEIQQMGQTSEESSQKVEELGTQTEQSAKKVSSGGMSIGQSFQFMALNAFNLAESLIGTKRAYEDIDRAKTRLEVTTNREKNAEATLKNEKAKLAAMTTKSIGPIQGEEIARRNLALAIAQEKDAIKEHGKKSQEAYAAHTKVLKAQQALNKVMGKGKTSQEDYAKQVDKVNRLEAGVKTKKDQVALAQRNVNRAEEDFYLSIIPNVISGVGTLAGIMQVGQGANVSWLGSMLKFGIPLAIIGGVLLAIKTNFLGVRDAVQTFGFQLGQALPFLQPFLNLLQAVGEALGILPDTTLTVNKALADLKAQIQPIIDTFKTLIDQIMKGDWEGAFKTISDAANKGWEALKKAFPLLGDIQSTINTIIEDIKKGDWAGVAKTIKESISKGWKSLVDSGDFPVLNFISDVGVSLGKGDWSGAATKIKDGINTAVKTVTGIDLSGLEAQIQEGVNQFLIDPVAFLENLAVEIGAQVLDIALNVNAIIKSVTGFDIAQWFKDNPITPDTIIDIGVTINATIKSVTGFDIVKWFTDHPITSKVPFFAGITMMVDDPKFRASVIAGAIDIVTAIGNAIVSISPQMDKFLADLINAIDWDASVESALQSLKDGGQKIWDALFKGVGEAAGKADWGKIISDAVVGISKSKTAAATGSALGKTPLAKGLKGVGLSDKPLTIQDISNMGKGKPLDVARQAGIELNPVVLAQKAWDWLNKALSPQTAAGGTGFGHPLTGQQGAYGGPGPGTGQQGAYGGPGKGLMSTMGGTDWFGQMKQSLEQLKALFLQVQTAANTMGTSVIQSFTTMQSTVMSITGTFIQAMAGAMTSLGTVMSTSIINSSTSIIQSFTTVYSTVMSITGTFIQAMAGAFTSLGTVMRSSIAQAGTSVIQSFTAIYAPVMSITGTFIKAMATAFTSLGTVLMTSMNQAGIGIIQSFTTTYSTIMSITGTTIKAMANAFKSLATAIASNMSSISKSMATAGSAATSLASKINALKSKSITITTTYTTVYRTIRAAKGFHGMVSSPMNFTAGEAGPEMVDVTPLNGGGSRKSFTTTAMTSSSRGGGSGNNQPMQVNLVVDGLTLARAMLPYNNRFISQFK